MTHSGTEGISPYRIRLRGPWRSQPLARAERSSDGNLIWTTADLPQSTTIRLPASWQDLFGSFRGRIRFQRKFHPPSNIAPGDRLAIVFEQVAGRGTVLLNGEPLGQITPESIRTRLDVTGRLTPNNELTIDLDFTEFAPQSPPGGLTTPIALEIEAAAK
jgi:beta-galactosidase/beta-glucuronidase